MDPKYTPKCRSCKNDFDVEVCIPHLLKCGHYYCKNCIQTTLTDSDGNVYCPTDGYVNTNITERKNKPRVVNSKPNQTGYCTLHPTQKFSHYIEDTKEVICVYCAFKKFKNN